MTRHTHSYPCCQWQARAQTPGPAPWCACSSSTSTWPSPQACSTPPTTCRAGRPGRARGCSAGVSKGKVETLRRSYPPRVVRDVELEHGRARLVDRNVLAKRAERDAKLLGDRREDGRHLRLQLLDGRVGVDAVVDHGRALLGEGVDLRWFDGWSYVSRRALVNSPKMSHLDATLRTREEHKSR